jgi:sporulation protein YlmC with PRC-barrel domain
MPQTFEMAQGYTAVDSDNLASELIDQPVYSSAGDDAEEIGNVTDLVFDEQGSIAAVVIGVGGFLGIGEKSVAVPYDALQFVIAADNTERWVVETTAEALNGAPEFVWEEDEPADEGDAAAEGDAMAPADGGAMAPADPAAAPATN